jgi:8-oxo-dGTP diphosphatase
MSDWSDVPVFGARDARETIVRPSAYGLAANETGMVAVVRTSMGLFLPGGGIDPGESPTETVVREFWEECGLEVAVGAWSVRAIDFVYSPNDRVVFEKLSTFVHTTWTGRRGVAQEPDHELDWVSPAVAISGLRDPSARWAVEQWLARDA